VSECEGWLTDALHERGDIFELSLSRVVGVFATHTASARAHAKAREVLHEEGHDETRIGVTISQRAGDKDQRWPFPSYAARDFGAVARNDSVYPIVHRPTSAQRADAFVRSGAPAHIA
jgi:hypothetical protein